MTPATNRRLTDQAGAELWHIIDAREWFVRLVTKDFATELEQIDRQLAKEL
jgi:hypothetical protein